MSLLLLSSADGGFFGCWRRRLGWLLLVELWLLDCLTTWLLVICRLCLYSSWWRCCCCCWRRVMLTTSAVVDECCCWRVSAVNGVGFVFVFVNGGRLDNPCDDNSLPMILVSWSELSFRCTRWGKMSPIHTRCSRCADNRDETADEGIGSMRYFSQITMCCLYIFSLLDTSR